MTRAVIPALLLLAGLAHAEDPGLVPGNAPTPVITTSLRVHLIASEDLDPDALRALARPGVVLWLSTRTNTLRESTLDTLNQFTGAWVELRAPLTAPVLKQLTRSPRAGVWLRHAEQGLLPAVRPGPQRLAIGWKGPFDETQAQAIGRLSPAQVEWTADAQSNLLSWSLFKNLPGKLLFRPEPDAVVSADCEQKGRQRVALAVHIGFLGSLGTEAFPCGSGARVRLAPDTDAAAVLAAVARDPSAELELDVGAELANVRKARLLFDAIGLVPGATR